MVQKAMGLIKDNETIFIDISTTNIELAELDRRIQKRIV